MFARKGSQLGPAAAPLARAVRAAAKQFDVSKSTVHTDVSKRLLLISPALAQAVRLVLDENKAQRHIRGGNATKEKYAVLSEKKVD